MVHLQNADIVLIVTLAMLGTLVAALRLHPRGWLSLLVEALLVNLLAVAAVLTLEWLPVLLA
jgi:hypothetical protein